MADAEETKTEEPKIEAKKRKPRVKRKTAEKRTVTRKETVIREDRGPTILGLPQTPVILALVVIAFGIGIVMSGRTPSTTPAGGQTPAGGETTTITPSSSYGTVKLDFYVMSQCPYGTQVEDAIKPVLDKLGKAVDFSINFIATDLGGGKFSSLHGQPEVDENIRQLCAIKYYPNTYMDYIVCRNKNIQSPSWQSCASQAGIDTGKIQACFDGGEGAQLHSASIQESEAVGAQGSPTIYVNNQPYQGGRDSNAFQRALCANLQGHPACANLPPCGLDTDCTAQPGKIGRCQNPNTQEAKCVYSEDVKFEIIVLNDKQCGTSCDTTQLSQVLKQMFIAATLRSVDISTDEGKKLVGELGITVVPAYIFEPKVTTSYTWETNTRIQSAFERKGNYYKLSDDATGASWFVSAEARKKYQDAIGLSPGDNKPQVDFFVMSYCPYGNQAEEAIAGAYDILGDKAAYIPHYVIYENYGGGGPNYCLENGQYCSMHGIQELNQDIRELCVYKSLGAGKYFAFVKAMNKKCSAQNADSCWTAVASDLGLDTKAISQCEKDEGLALVKKEKELNKVLKVSGSPTVFVEGDQFNGARTASGFASALCGKFSQAPAECANIPADTAAAAAPAGGGCG